MHSAGPAVNPQTAPFPPHPARGVPPVDETMTRPVLRLGRAVVGAMAGALVGVAFAGLDPLWVPLCAAVVGGLTWVTQP